MDVLGAAGSDINSLIATGGGAKNDQWLQMISDITQVEITRPVAGDFGAALGAARLGAIASGAADESILTKPMMASCFAPQSERNAHYGKRRRNWQKLYQLVKEVR